MGFFKKAFKKVTKVVSKAGGDPAGLLGGDDEKPKEGAAVVAPPAPAAAQVEAPKEDSTTKGEGDSEAAQRATKAKGKRSLSVARSSGTGLNV